MSKKPYLTTESLVEFVEQRQGIGRRDIAAYFNVKGKEAAYLKTLLDEAIEKNHLRKKGRLYYGALKGLPTFLSKPKPSRFKGSSNRASFSDKPLLIPVQVTEPNEEGDITLEPLQWTYKSPKPSLILKPTPQAPAIGDVILVKCWYSPQGPLVAEYVKSLEGEQERIIGTYQKTDTGDLFTPSNRKDNRSFVLDFDTTQALKHNDIIEVEILQTSRGRHVQARMVENFGQLGKDVSPTFIAIKDHGLATTFSPQALHEANQAKVPPLDERVDLRELPLVTIDDEDARDFDDAIYAQPDTDETNPKGWIIWVAIADVSAYVTPDAALDNEAFKRGNSVYFPDQVLPMLPENLSNTICSLKPDEDRACLAVKMRIDSRGNLLDYTFMRALMKSAGRLTYRLVHEALKDRLTPYAGYIRRQILNPLYKAYKVLRNARNERGALNIERTEERIYLDEQGKVTHISPRMHYESHEIVEEMMILANVAAARFLTERTTPSIFRVHDQPDPQKIHDLSDFLQPLGLVLTKGQTLHPKTFNRLLTVAKKTPYNFMVQELVLRAQARAVYSAHNNGHYGLNLPRYVHFTSPIRRYADLVVHRAIIALLQQKKGEAYPYTVKDLEEIAEHISITERKASKAERDTIERFIAIHLSQKVGETFECRIVGVTDFGLFVEILNNGIQGLIPFRLLPDDRYDYKPKQHCLKGRYHKQIFSLGDLLKAKLEETEPISGSVLLSVIQTSSSKKSGKGKSGKLKYSHRKSSDKAASSSKKRRS